MITIRKANDRGHSDIGWLDSRHSFSFSDYYDPDHMGFASLRVINDDKIAAGAGFGTHPHRDMEIITYVLEGELAHRDSMGHTEVLRAGELQRMTAGTGLTHSEFNPSPTQPLHLYQIWIMPDRKGHTPSYDQKKFDPAGRANQWQQVVTSDSAATTATNGAAPLRIHQDATVNLANLEPGKSIDYAPAPNRAQWLQVLRGDVTLNGHTLTVGDGAAISGETKLTLTGANTGAEVMLFDLA